MNLPIAKAVAASAFVLGAFAIHKTQNYFYHKLDVNNSFKAIYTGGMTRTPIFSNGPINTHHLVNLVSYKSRDGRARMQIDESKLETTLKPFIREQLRKVFRQKGWDFEELNGRIYYHINDSELEVYLTWKNNSFAAKPTNYDRLTISF